MPNVENHVKDRIRLAQDAKDNGIIIGQNALEAIIASMERGTGPLARENTLRVLRVINENLRVGITAAKARAQ